jgi:hypothetical protein
MIARVPGRYRRVFPLGTGSPATVNIVGLEVRCTPAKVDEGAGPACFFRGLPLPLLGGAKFVVTLRVPGLRRAMESVRSRMKVKRDGVPKTSC